MQTGEVEANLINLNQIFNLSYVTELIDRKIQGTEKGILQEIDLEFYRNEYECLVSELEKAMEKSNLPEKPSGKAELNDLLIRLRMKSG